MDKIDKAGAKYLRRVFMQMKKLGINQSELARRMKVSRPYVSLVLKHDINISFVTATKLARALSMDFEPELISRSPRHGLLHSRELKVKELVEEE